MWNTGLSTAGALREQLVEHGLRGSRRSHLAGTWFAQRQYQSAAQRRADVAVSFHWLTARAKVVIPGREPLCAGYHLILDNRGPALATDVNLVVQDADGTQLTLLDIAPSEFPLSRLDAGVRYSIPWLYEPFTPHARRFIFTVTWNDEAGPQEWELRLRRGQVPG